MNTGENAEALRKIADFIRKSSICLLCLHFYVYCYSAFEEWQLTHSMVRQLLENIGRTGLFKEFYISKAGALLLLIVSLVGTKGKKEEKLKLSTALRLIISGLIIYGTSYLLLRLEASVAVLGGLYITVTAIGYLLILNGGILLTRLLKQRLDEDIFNQLQETL
jgi:hypothetical protein